MGQELTRSPLDRVPVSPRRRPCCRPTVCRRRCSHLYNPLHRSHLSTSPLQLYSPLQPLQPLQLYILYTLQPSTTPLCLLNLPNARPLAACVHACGMVADTFCERGHVDNGHSNVLEELESPVLLPRDRVWYVRVRYGWCLSVEFEGTPSP